MQTFQKCKKLSKDVYYEYKVLLQEFMFVLFPLLPFIHVLTE